MTLLRFERHFLFQKNQQNAGVASLVRKTLVSKIHLLAGHLEPCNPEFLRANAVAAWSKSVKQQGTKVEARCPVLPMAHPTSLSPLAILLQQKSRKLLGRRSNTCSWRPGGLFCWTGMLQQRLPKQAGIVPQGILGNFNGCSKFFFWDAWKLLFDGSPSSQNYKTDPFSIDGKPFTIPDLLAVLGRTKCRYRLSR